MDEAQAIPFWGPEQLQLFDLMAQAIDPDERIPAAMRAVAPIESRALLDVGADAHSRLRQQRSVRGVRGAAVHHLGTSTPKG